MSAAPAIDGRSRPSRDGARSAAYSILVGLTTLLILLQAVWAGLFVREGEGYEATWVHAHEMGALAAIVLAVLAVFVVFWRLRARTDLQLGTLVLLALLVVQTFLGYAAVHTPWLGALHFPLALLLMGVAVWLPLRAARH